MSVLYIYAIATETPEHLGAGMKRERLRVVSFRKLAMIVGDLPASPAMTPEHLRTHDAVVKRLAALCGALLPARFGTVSSDEAALRSQLRSRSRELSAALALVGGCVQMTLRVFGTAAAPIRAKAPKRPAAPAGVGPGTRYLAERAQAIEAAGSLPEIEPLRARVSGLVRAERAERQDREGLIGTAYHLVERNRVAAYRRRVKAASELLGPIRVHLTGPWAPYAFAS